MPKKVIRKNPTETYQGNYRLLKHSTGTINDGYLRIDKAYPNSLKYPEILSVSAGLQ